MGTTSISRIITCLIETFRVWSSGDTAAFYEIE